MITGTGLESLGHDPVLQVASRLIRRVRRVGPTDRQVGVAPTRESWAQIPLYQVASCMSLGKSLTLPELGFLVYNVGLTLPPE